MKKGKFIDLPDGLSHLKYLFRRFEVLFSMTSFLFYKELIIDSSLKMRVLGNYRSVKGEHYHVIARSVIVIIIYS